MPPFHRKKRAKPNSARPESKLTTLTNCGNRPRETRAKLTSKAKILNHTALPAATPSIITITVAGSRVIRCALMNAPPMVSRDVIVAGLTTVTVKPSRSAVRHVHHLAVGPWGLKRLLGLRVCSVLFFFLVHSYVCCLEECVWTHSPFPRSAANAHPNVGLWFPRLHPFVYCRLNPFFNSL
ncbi:MAG: hypothetical protein PWR31_1666 [Bacillota bacterium]|nr:hypothetical protein [Bacillota bacterium]